VTTLVTLFAVGLITILVAGVLLSVLGVVFSLTLGVASVLLFKIAPIVFVGWLVVKLFDRKKTTDRLSAADRAWLDSPR
jgi:hypothetical protein